MRTSLALGWNSESPESEQTEAESTAASLPSLVNLNGFIAGALGFFATVTKQAATIGSPYVEQSVDEKPHVVLQEFTASIRLTGRHRGTIYVTASRAMLTIMLMRMGATDITIATIGKALRDLATATADGARRDMNDELLAWSAAVSAGGARQLERSERERQLVAPIHWRNYTAHLALCIE